MGKWWKRQKKTNKTNTAVIDTAVDLKREFPRLAEMPLRPLISEMSAGY